VIRLAQLPTLRIHPEKKIALEYRGKRIEGVEGDTIATALFSNGIRIFSRSQKYHRPRGLYCLDGECSNTMMSVDGTPNVCTENTLAKNGMAIKAQNVTGSPEFDFLGFLDKLGWAMPAGFYYRLFHKPAALWPLAIKQIRKRAGLGKLAPALEMKGVYDEIYLNADVCVIGGGPAGMCAALAASDKGLRVILLESRSWLGGYFEYRPAQYLNGVRLFERARALAEQILQAPNIRIFTDTPMIGAYNNNLITAIQRGGASDVFEERYVEIRAESVVAATGCIERPLLFQNNERPGVMQVACAHRLARTYGLLPGKQSVFSIGNDLGLEAAVDLFDLGLQVLCVADLRESGQDPGLIAELHARKIPYFRGWVAAKAGGNKTLESVTLTDISGKRQQKHLCDSLVASAGLSPLTGPLTLAGAELVYDDHTGYFLPTRIPEKIQLAGRLLGLQHPLSVETSGRLAGLRAAADCGVRLEAELQKVKEKLNALPGPERGSNFVAPLLEGKKTFICFDEDTTTEHIRQAMQMGFDQPELIKRFTSAGTGPGQGGIPGHNLPLYVGRQADSGASAAKPTTVRPPLVPSFLAAYAGAHRNMFKRTPVHDLQTSAGAKMERVGVWYRARRFSDDPDASKEIENVRNNVGLLDASTLGKFRLHGPDALKALQRIYVGDMSDLIGGKVKYAAMCNEDGCIIDDGVVIKQGENDYYFTTSSARSDITLEWIRYHTRYDDWNYSIVDLTDAFGVINLAGPNARKVLQKVTSTDVSKEAFPFLGDRQILIENGVSLRVMRLGFVGELSYELHVPSSYMQSVWRLLEQAGKEFAIMNFGLEAQNCLRMEKGHLIIGSESEARTTLHDVGLGHLWFRNKPEAKTVGAVALKHTENQHGRLKLIGFNMEENSRAPKDGSLIVDSKIRGYVCTARYSTTLRIAIGMALVESHLAKIGNRLKIFEDGLGAKRLEASVVPMPFYDPQGKRLKM
jgi:sarcosine oxidase subunit alpha